MPRGLGRGAKTGFAIMTTLAQGWLTRRRSRGTCSTV